MNDFIYACKIRLLDSGDYFITGYDRASGRYAGWWLSSRMVKISASAADSLLLCTLRAMLQSSRIIEPDSVNENALLHSTLQFGGFRSHQQMDSHSKMLFVEGRCDGWIQLTPTRYEHRQGFAHESAHAQRLHIDSRTF